MTPRASQVPELVSQRYIDFGTELAPKLLAAEHSVIPDFPFAHPEFDSQSRKYMICV